MTPAWLKASELSSIRNEHNQIQSGFALLVQRRKEIGAAPLRRLCLSSDTVLVEPIGWQSLSQCAELESIEAEWSSES